MQVGMGVSTLKNLSRVLLAVAGLTVLAVMLGGGESEPQLPRAVVPEGGLCPDALTRDKVLYIVYGRKGGDIFFARSADDGQSISNPVPINTGSTRAVVGHERGPKLAVGRSGIVHVIWMGPVGQLGLFYSRSTDGGKSFSPPRNLVPAGVGVDGSSVAADDRGQVFIVALGGEPGPQSPASAQIQLAYSADDGASFAAVRNLRSDYPGGACACCNLKALAGAAGKLLIAYRGAYRSIRDIYLLRGAADSPRFESSHVSADNWKLDGCPMQGPSVELMPDGSRLVIAWTSQGQVYRSVSDDGGRTFARRAEPVAAVRGNRRDPLLLTNGRGESLFAWVEKGEVCWERIAPDGKLLASGRNAGLPGNSRPQAVVRSDGQFALVY